VVDDAGRVLLWNSSMARITGFQSAEAVGRPHHEVLNATPVWCEDIAGKPCPPGQPIHYAQTGPIDVVVHTKSGAEARARLSVSPLEIPEGGPQMQVLTLIETAEYQLEKLKDELISLASHELRTPLTSIKGYAALLQKTGRFDARAVDVILQQSSHLQRLIKDMLDAVRLQTGQLRLCLAPLDLSQLAAEVIERYSGLGTDRRFVLEAEEEAPLAQADRDLLEQALGALLDNAISYSPAGSIVKVEVKLLRPEPGWPEAFTAGRWAQVIVSDQGIGIPRSDLPYLFQRFYRGNQEEVQRISGAGLGLYRVREIVEQHGGRIWVESELGQGTAFYFTLPSADAAKDTPS